MEQGPSVVQCISLSQLEKEHRWADLQEEFEENVGSPCCPVSLVRPLGSAWGKSQ